MSTMNVQQKPPQPPGGFARGVGRFRGFREGTTILIILVLGVITLALAGATFVIVRDRPSDINLPSIQEIEAMELGELASEVKTTEKIPMGRALKMTFGSGMKF